MSRTQIEMQDLSKTEGNNALLATKVYGKFPFSVGKDIKINFDFEKIKVEFDLKAWLASANYQSQPADNLSKPIDRFWDRKVSLVNLCCKSIAKKLLKDPAYYKKRTHTLPQELNDAINQKLDEVEQGICNEKLLATLSILKSTY